MNFSKIMVLLCVVPLIFEMCFVAELFNLLTEFEQARAKEATARELGSHLNKLVETLVESATAAGFGAVAEDEEFEEMFRKGDENVRFELKYLSDLSAKLSPDESSQVQRLVAVASEYRGCIESMRKGFLAADKVAAREALAKSNPLKDEMILTNQKISMTQSDIERMKAREQADRLSWLFTFLLGGLVINALLIVVLMWTFNVLVLSRLRKVKQNTVNLAVDNPLSPPLYGDDEFAQLDRFFRRMARSLQLARKSERAVLENSPDVICSLDAKTRFTAVNPACEKVWGYKPADLLGSRWSQIVPSEQASKLIAQIKDMNEAFDLRGLELPVQHKDGHLVDMLWSGQWSEGKKSLFFVAHDNTDVKRAEKLRNEFTRLLRDNLKAPLVNIQAVHSRFEADEFGEISEPGKKRLLVASRELQRLIGLVNGLLDVHKLGKDLDLQIEQTNLAGVVHSSAHAVGGFAERQHVRINTDASRDIWMPLDRERMIQVLVNLLSNAVKFSPPDSVVTVGIEESNGLVTLYVRDEGRGVPLGMRDKIFERFKQVEKADAHQKGGTGLGLAICKAIVEQHGGKIGVDSEEGKGSTFWIRLARPS